MKISRMFKLSLAKKLTAAGIIALAFAFPAASLAAQTVKLESSFGVANVTKGDTNYKPSVNAGYDNVVKMEVYYHNTELPDSGKVAQNLTVKIGIPEGAGKTQTVSSKVSADNANTVKNTATINLDSDQAYLQYIKGSAVWKHNTGTNQNVHIVETKISDAVVTSDAGLNLEDEKPCYNFAATVTVLARVMTPAVQVTKQVEKASETNKWSQLNAASPSEVLKYKISYKNNGNTNQSDVLIRDSLPTKMTLVPNTTYLYNSNNPSGVLYNSNNITHGGIVIGDYVPGGIAYITFEVTAPAADALACGPTTFTNVGVAQPKGMNEYFSEAKTVVTKTCANTPVYTCDAFGITTSDNRTVTVNNFKYTAKNGATFKNVVIDWGDNSTDLTTNTAVGQKYTYAKDGTYKITATTHFTLAGKDVVAPVGVCTQTVKFTNGTPTPPSTPTSLVKTGPGEVLALFAGAMVAGTVASRLFLSRKLTR